MEKSGVRVADLYLDFVNLRDSLPEDTEAREVVQETIDMLNQIDFNLVVLKELGIDTGR